MSEQESMDRFLRETMAATPPPTLSPSFDQRLKKRLRPRRLNAAGRRIMAAYALLTLIVSIWAMRSESLDWLLIVVAILAPLIVVLAIQYPQRPRTARR